MALALYLLTPIAGSPLHDAEIVRWVGLTAGAAAAVLAFRRRLRPTDLMGAQVLAIAAMSDFGLQGGEFRDFHLYVRAGAEWLAGRQPYTLEALHHYPPSGDQLPFLYPPPLLPVLGLLSTLPSWLSDGLWLAMSVAALLVALRLIGLSWLWCLAAIAWTPIEQGLYTGNIVIPSLLLLALAPRAGGWLTVGPLFKPQNGVVMLWLLRERAWRPLALGVGFVAAVVIVTLPLTGLGAWSDWFTGLTAYQGSQANLHGLYGVGLGRYMPMWTFLLVAAATIGAALLASGRDGLARLGLASVVASPSLWNHGYVWALPAFLKLRGNVLWLIAGVMCEGGWPGPQLVLAIGVASWFVPAMVRRPAAGEAGKAAGPARIDELHPLGAELEPWPGEAIG